MPPSTYSPPVSALLEIGDPRKETSRRDYLALGLGSEHVPDLIRLMQDEALNQADSESAEVWGPLHAWRALGQLRAEPAIEPLLGLLRRIDDEDDDWVGSELPGVFGQIGAAAIVPLEQYAASAENPEFARSAAMNGLKEIGQQHPEARDAAVTALTRLLENYAQPGRDPSLNAFLISDLVDMHALEAAPLMERAFAADAVELDIRGDWEDIQVELGLKEKRTTEPEPRAGSASREPAEGSALETIQLIQQLTRQQSRAAKTARTAVAAKTEAAAQPAGPKRKHHRRKN